jgi:hypothetical protein
MFFTHFQSFLILKIKYTSRRIFLYVTSFISISKYFFSSFFFLQKYQYLLLCLSFYIYIYICSKLFYYYTYVFADLYSSFIHISCVYTYFLLGMFTTTINSFQ